MDKDLPHSTRQRLDAALSTWKDWSFTSSNTAPVAQILPGGHTNDSFVLQLGSNKPKAVLRLNSTRTVELGIDRERELKVLDLLSKSEFTPEIYFIGQDFLVSEFVHGRPLEKKNLTNTTLEAIASLTHGIHNLSPSLGSQLSLIDELGRLFRLIKNNEIQNRLTDIHARLLKTAAVTTRALQLESETLALCHHDLLLDNLILSNEKIRIIDWEYANLGDPLFDLAIFIEANELSEIQRNRFLQSCEKQDFSDVIRAHQTLYRYLEILWWLVREQDMTQNVTPRVRHMIVNLKKRL